MWKTYNVSTDRPKYIHIGLKQANNPLYKLLIVDILLNVRFWKPLLGMTGEISGTDVVMLPTGAPGLKFRLVTLYEILEVIVQRNHNGI